MTDGGPWQTHPAPTVKASGADIERFLRLPALHADPGAIRRLNVREWGMPTGARPGRAWKTPITAELVMVAILQEMPGDPTRLRVARFRYAGPRRTSAPTSNGKAWGHALALGLGA